MSRAARYSCVHGRFQPFHNGHLEYALRARERCERLVVGITNADPTWFRPEAENEHRHEPSANPFTYFERATMVRDTLLGEGLRAGDFAIVPFPIHAPERIPFYVPDDALHFIRVYSTWEREKVRRLKSRGLKVEVLASGEEKVLSATEVRELLRAHRPWQHLVPDGARAVIEKVLATDPERLLV